MLILDAAAINYITLSAVASSVADTVAKRAGGLEIDRKVVRCRQDMKSEAIRFKNRKISATIVPTLSDSVPDQYGPRFRYTQ